MQKDIESLGINMAQQQYEKLNHMLDLLAKWNQIHNLTRLTKRRDQEIYHILDALSASAYFKPYHAILDIGTGAGFPGIPLAILYPDKQFHLLDANGKKIAYLRMLVHQLGLNNVKLYHERIENIKLSGIDCITSRAVSNPKDLLSLTKGFSAVQYILYMGPSHLDEAYECIELNVPGSQKHHYLALLYKGSNS